MNYSAYFTDGPIELRMTGDVIHCAVGPPTVNGKRVMALTIFFPLKYRNHGWIGRHTRLVFRIRKRGIEWKSANTLINHIVIGFFFFFKVCVDFLSNALRERPYKSWCLLHCVCVCWYTAIAFTVKLQVARCVCIFTVETTGFHCY